MNLENYLLPEFAVIFAILCVTTRVSLVMFDRKLYSSFPNRFDTYFTVNSAMPFLVSCTVVLPLIDSLSIHDFFQPSYALHGLLALLSARAVSAGLKLMNVRYVSMISKFADVFIYASAVILFVPFEYTKFALLMLTVIAYIPMILTGFTNEKIGVGPAIFIVICLWLQSIISKSVQVPMDSSDAVLRFILFSMGWRFVFSVLHGLRTSQAPSVESGADSKQYNSLAQGPILSIFLVLRGIVAFASQSFFFLAILNPNSLLAWPILNAGPLFASVISAIVLKEKMNKTELASVSMLLMIFVGGFLNWN